MKFAGMKSISGKLFNVFALFSGIVVLYDFGEGGGGDQICQQKLFHGLGNCSLLLVNFSKIFFI